MNLSLIGLKKPMRYIRQRIYSKLLNWRTKGDYSDMFDFTQEDVASVMEPTRAFIDKVKQLIEKGGNSEVIMKD